MNILISFILLATFLITCLIIYIIYFDRVEKYAKKNPNKYFFRAFVLVTFIAVWGCIHLLNMPPRERVTNAQEVLTGYVFHIHQEHRAMGMQPGPGMPTGNFFLLGETPMQTYRMGKQNLREDGQVDTYVLKNAKTKEQRTMRRLDGDERVYRTRIELLEYNELIEKGGIK